MSGNWTKPSRVIRFSVYSLIGINIVGVLIRKGVTGRSILQKPWSGTGRGP